MQVVVGAAIVGAGRLLVAQRAYPQELAGRWELPGGKVEPGETEPAAVVRECREELGVGVEVGVRVGPELVIRDGLVLHAWSARLVEGEPTAIEHADLRWIGAVEVAGIAWLPTNAPLVPHLERLLR